MSTQTLEVVAKTPLVIKSRYLHILSLREFLQTNEKVYRQAYLPFLPPYIHKFYAIIGRISISYFNLNLVSQTMPIKSPTTYVRLTLIFYV